MCVILWASLPSPRVLSCVPPALCLCLCPSLTPSLPPSPPSPSLPSPPPSPLPPTSVSLFLSHAIHPHTPHPISTPISPPQLEILLRFFVGIELQGRLLDDLRVTPRRRPPAPSRPVPPEAPTPPRRLRGHVIIFPSVLICMPTAPTPSASRPCLVSSLGRPILLPTPCRSVPLCLSVSVSPCFRACLFVRLPFCLRPSLAPFSSSAFRFLSSLRTSVSISFPHFLSRSRLLASPCAGPARK